MQTPKAGNGVSKALSIASFASSLDAQARYRGQNVALYDASAVASMRLIATVFEEMNESGITAAAEKMLLADPDAFYNYNDADDAVAVSAGVATLGFKIDPSVFIWHTVITLDDKRNALTAIRSNGLHAYYRYAVKSLSNHVLDESFKDLVGYHSGAHRVDVNCLDGWSCRAVKIGAILCAATGDPIGAGILAAWAAACC